MGRCARLPGTAGAVPAAGARPHDIILAAMNAAFRRPAINRRTAAAAPQQALREAEQVGTRRIRTWRACLAEW